MTLAATRRYALALSGVVGLAASILAATLIAIVLGSPERVALATNDGDLSSIVHLILEGLGAVATALWRLLT